MTKLHRLHDEQDQSPWLDNLTRDHLRSGHLERLVCYGVRGVTAKPTILANAIAGSDAYDDQFAQLVDGGATTEDVYWELVIADVVDALDLLAHDADASAAAAAHLHQHIDRPNLLVKIPATAPASTPSARRPPVDQLIGPDTMTTLPEPTIAAFEDHGTVSRTIDEHPAAAAAVLTQIGDLGVDLADVGRTLEDQGVAVFARSLAEVLGRLHTKAAADV